ncbi:MAG: 3-deoxy-D-manno-octulosonic acid transferase [Flavobacteriales bacterium CG_4_10_14_0_2_um_filter_32_8]|nr:MAG: 3-deoxy-D-manno-octulosonic acid transferase [Flavobacteriales bacterium CG_4_10_14_0_2_um_filter_32_8]
MLFFYQITIHCYYLILKIASIFNPKAKLWIKGRQRIFEQLKIVEGQGNIFWFHCASLGELEQGKPIIEKLKAQDNTIKILLTFFSPSGYEIGKKYKKADYVFYLPLDSATNAKRFIKIVNPKKAFFIKYEFWYHYLNELHQQNIPIYLISGVFRENQPFFKWYGSFHKKMLNFFTHFFVQNTDSEKLLTTLGYQNITVAGDTRLDRVYENSLFLKQLPLIQKFVENKTVIIAGSSWQKEEKILGEFITSCQKDFKYIIAPHDISLKHIQEIENLLETDFIKYSEATLENISSYRSLIIDNIGILANTYQFTDIAFVGGGFTGALHNILEPASFGNVVLFGPKHTKFHEAEELLQLKGAFEIDDTDDMIAIVNHLLVSTTLEQSKTAALNYIKNGKGATELIFEKLKIL